MPFREAGLLEVPAHLGAIGAGEAEQVLYISQVLHEPGRVVDAWPGPSSPRGARPGAREPCAGRARRLRGAGREQQARRLRVHVDEVHAAPVGIRVLVVRVARRRRAASRSRAPAAASRSAPGRPSPSAGRGRRWPGSARRRGAPEPPRARTDGRARRAARASRSKTRTKSRRSPPGRENSTRGYAPRMASTGCRREARSAG